MSPNLFSVHLIQVAADHFDIVCQALDTGEAQNATVIAVYDGEVEVVWVEDGVEFLIFNDAGQGKSAILKDADMVMGGLWRACNAALRSQRG